MLITSAGEKKMMKRKNFREIILTVPNESCIVSVISLK